jgi:hypothetical protein
MGSYLLLPYIDLVRQIILRDVLRYSLHRFAFVNLVRKRRFCDITACLTSRCQFWEKLNNASKLQPQENGIFGYQNPNLGANKTLLKNKDGSIDVEFTH